MRKRAPGQGEFGRLGAAALGLLARCGRQPEPRRDQTEPPRLLGLRVSNGGTPFAGDTPQPDHDQPERGRLPRPRPDPVQARPRRDGRGEGGRDRRGAAAGACDLEHEPPVRGRGAHDRLGCRGDRLPTARISSASPSAARRARDASTDTSRRGEDRLTSGLVVRVQGIQAGFFNRSYPVGGAAKLAVSHRREAGPAPALLVRRRAEPDRTRPADERARGRSGGSPRLEPPPQRAAPGRDQQRGRSRRAASTSCA